MSPAHDAAQKRAMNSAEVSPGLSGKPEVRIVFECEAVNIGNICCGDGAYTSPNKRVCVRGECASEPRALRHTRPAAGGASTAREPLQ